MKKECSLCGEVKQLSEYWKNKKARDGFYAHCKICHLLLSKKTREKYREKYREKSKISIRIWRKNNPKRAKEIAKEFREKNKEKINEKVRLRRLKLKLEVIQKYGGKCSCCGLSDIRFLCLDHKDNDGYQDRKNGIKDLISYSKKNNYPNKLRIMCFNCNFGRAFYGGKEKICPHKL